jgi:hypothetical protein
MVEASGIALGPRSGTRRQLGEAETSIRQPKGTHGPSAFLEVRERSLSIGDPILRGPGAGIEPGSKRRKPPKSKKSDS